jgi:alkaline phosphatase D
MIFRKAHFNIVTFFLLIEFCSVSVVLSQKPEFGVTLFKADKTDSSYRLVSSRNLEAAHLIAPKGRTVHSWYYAHTDEKTSDFSNFGMTWHYAEMLPNGNLLAIVKDEMIIELDWSSNLVWKANLRAHHDFARAENGNTIVVSRRDIQHPLDQEKTIAMDQLVEFNLQGDIVWTWNYEDHSADVEKLVEQPLWMLENVKDWPHINTCEILPENPSGKNDKRFKAGNLLLCGRHSNTIMVVDKQSGRVVWAWGPGVLEGPHHPNMLPNGNILIYDNGQHTYDTARKFTRILELNPLNGQIVWEYGEHTTNRFYSPSRGSANRLPNGNTLIADSDNGRLFEVTCDGELVWEYLNPDRSSQGKRMALYRTIPYDLDLVESLLNQFGDTQDVLPRESLEFRNLNSKDLQYKQLIREVVFYLECGYYDHALKFVNNFMEFFPDDEEGYWAYSLIYAVRKDIEKSFEYMQKALDAGLPVSRFTAGLPALFDPLTGSKIFHDFIKGMEYQLVHGPVLGNITDQSVSIWIRTYSPQEVSIKLTNSNDPKDVHTSEIISTQMDKENTAVIKATGLQKSTEYTYEIKINNQVYSDPGYTFRTAPAPGSSAKFTLGFGGGAGYTPHHEYMWDTIKSHDPALFLLLGDNVYIDHPERPAVQKYCYYRRQSRPEYRRFTSGTPVYAIWDDHDFTYNDARGGPERDVPTWKRDVLNVFKNQFLNPYYGGGEDNPGCWFNFSYADVDFFMLDTRYYREDPKNDNASMLGPVQKKWLFEKLKSSKGKFKILASSVPWARGTKPGSLDTWDGHNNEREEIFSFIEENKIDGIILLSADRHRSDAWKIERPQGYDLYDFMSSKLTNIHTHKLMPGSLFGYNKKCSFGLLSFDTHKSDPTVTYRIINIDNEEIHRIRLFQSDLSFQ